MIQFCTKNLEVRIDDHSRLSDLLCAATGKSYISGEECSPFIRIAVDGHIEEPECVTYSEHTGIMIFDFMNSEIRIEVASKVQESYLTFEVVRITGDEPDVLLWGPYETSMAESIGESVGVVLDGDYAIGIQALNEKTIGGFPVDLSLNAISEHPYPDAKVGYDVSAAWPTPDGSLLQAYSRNRTKDERRTVWGTPDIPVMALSGPDALLTGTKIALFGCPAGHVLETIESIEIGENLPHPTIDGVWAKLSPDAKQSYLITDFSESTIVEAIAFAKQSGLKGLYHPDPFGNWGHFELKKASFPNGDAGLKACVEEAQREGVIVGVHTLTNFTTLNDPYVTPKPDLRLQLAGSAKLTAPAEAGDVEIEVEDPRPFCLQLFRRTIVIGDELVEYDSVTERAPWRLLGCRRGVNGTTASSHGTGTIVGRLWDHPYDVFFPNIELQDVYCDRLGELFRSTGLRQISFDGLEGVYATGHEGYAVNRFIKRCYDGWDREVINDASIVVSNYAWHVHTRFNWGEPWGAATREGQLDLRLHNQRYFARNFIPAMLGWFLIRSASDKFEATMPDEIEWVLSKAAGFDAGIALVADMAVLKRNGNAGELLAVVREWEQARRARAFNPEQRERMKDPAGDWHLEPAGEDRWMLYPVDISQPFICSPVEQQPGQPGGADWGFYNRHGEQRLRFSMRVEPSYGNMRGLVKRPTFYMNGSYMTFETEVEAGQYLVCEGDRIGRIFDSNWNLVKMVEAVSEPPMLKKGGQTVSFNCRFEGEPKPSVAVKLFTRGTPETAQSGQLG
ncbi:hypothetical protein [Paenibacillus sp. DMB20]|uniref:hypothetical protein n=1 Tax=Paenibacillus sp. DMB20 TaxID=1642570 RepID=UPI00069A0FD3|nr:hypothetical protein [Paenibacillus sp. DMB20]